MPSCVLRKFLIQKIVSASDFLLTSGNILSSSVKTLVEGFEKDKHDKDKDKHDKHDKDKDKHERRMVRQI